MIQENTVTSHELEQGISSFMLELGIPAHLRGYQYLRSAVEMCAEDMELVGSVTKLLYPDLAKKHKTTDQKIESEMRSKCHGKEEMVRYLKNCSVTVIQTNTADLQTVSTLQRWQIISGWNMN